MRSGDVKAAERWRGIDGLCTRKEGVRASVCRRLVRTRAASAVNVSVNAASKHDGRICQMHQRNRKADACGESETSEGRINKGTREKENTRERARAR